jgi:hypothetical protein
MNTPRYDFQISFSKYKVYASCPKKFHLKYILREVGVEFDETSAIFGIAIGKVFEWFYSRKYWCESNSLEVCIGSIEEAITYAFNDKKLNKNGDLTFLRELREKMHTYVPHGVSIIRENRFLSVMSDVEVDLTAVYKMPGQDLTLKIVGRPDFIHGSSKDDVFILDGKSSVHRGKYADNDQLILYAFLFYLRYNVVPRRLGFIFWQFPDTPISWIDYDANSFRSTVKKLFDASKKICVLKEFDPTPSKDCTLCPYKSGCKEGNDYMDIMGYGSKEKIDLSNSLFQVEFV